MALSIPVGSRRVGFAGNRIISHPVKKEGEPSPIAPVYKARPMEPLEIPPPSPEPAYGTVTPKQWEIWVAAKEEYVIYTQKRDRARAYALENDLRGVPFN